MPEGERLDAGGATLAVDVGGTFTDAVVTCAGAVVTAKSPTTPEDQSAGVMTAALTAIARAGLEPPAVASFVHGMTVTTNAMLEGRFARTALLATAGFTDVEELGRQNRPSLYRLCEQRPAPIVPDGLRFPIAERCGPDGVIDELDEDTVVAALEAAARAGTESIAVCLLFAFRHPAHERRIGELAAQQLPGVHVSLSHEVVGTFREYERFATTIADAALTPLLTGYLDHLVIRARKAGLPEPEVMLSNGGTVAAAVAARNAASTILSGPAGGTVGAARETAGTGARTVRALAFDMGGTSTDVSVVVDGRVRVTASREIDGRPVALPAADIFTVGAGGGSVAWRDSGGALRVGPRSAGALPGPACYGRGGTEPTVTDANMVLGRLGTESALAGGLLLDAQAAHDAVGALGESLGLGPVETASGIVEIANLEMLRATNAMTIARGIDPRDHVLVAFGGAGPMHGAAIAEALGIETVLCPATCGVLSAYGMALAGRRRDRSRSLVAPLETFDRKQLAAIADELVEQALADLGSSPTAGVSATYALRYTGQSFELEVDGVPGDDPAALGRRFADLHYERFGFAPDDAAIELVTLRVAAETPPQDVPGPAAGPGDAAPVTTTRDAWFDGELARATICRGAPFGDEPLSGPAIIELAEATVVVPPGWQAARTAHGATTLTRSVAR